MIGTVPEVTERIRPRQRLTAGVRTASAGGSATNMIISLCVAPGQKPESRGCAPFGVCRDPTEAGDVVAAGSHSVGPPWSSPTPGGRDRTLPATQISVGASPAAIFSVIVVPGRSPGRERAPFTPGGHETGRPHDHSGDHPGSASSLVTDATVKLHPSGCWSQPAAGTARWPVRAAQRRRSGSMAVVALGRGVDMVRQAADLIGCTLPVPAQVPASRPALHEIRDAYEHIEDRAPGPRP
jgi:hypothetical protein